MVQKSGSRKSRPFGGLRRLWDEESGASIIVIAVSFLALVGFVGLAIEVSYWYLERRAMQSATDSAALSGAYIMYEMQSTSPSNDPEITAAAKNDAKRNNYDDAAANVVVTVNHPFAGDQSKVEVIMTKDEASMFSSLFGAGATTIARRAVAQTAGSGAFCMLGLHPNCSQTVKLAGTADLVLEGCPIQSNSCSPVDAVQAQGTADLTTPSLSACGQNSPASNFLSGLNLTNSAGPLSPVQPMPDPYKDVPEYPNPGGCQPLPAGLGSQALADASPVGPGCYNNLNFAGGGTKFWSLAGGNYYQLGGQFNIGASDSVKGLATLTIHLGPNAIVSIGSNGNLVQLTAPTSGTYKDILFFQSRSAPEDSCGPFYSNTFNGGSTQSLAGTLYFPKQGVKVNGNAELAGTPQCLRVVSLFLEITGTADTLSNCTTDYTTITDLLPPTLIE